MRKDMFRVSLTVDGVDWGVWASKTGGKIDSEAISYKDGGMTPGESLGGPRNVEVITLERRYKHQRDHDRIQKLFNATGKGKCVVKQQPLDENGAAYGRPIVWTGTLKSTSTPDVDANSTSDAATYAVEITPDGDPTAV